MKHYSKLLFLAVSFIGLASCAINEVEEFPVEKPANLEQYEYLKEYDVLKNYVDRTAYPNFKLGAGVTASKFVQHGQEYLMAVSNFDEITPGNAMKHASVVANNGKMNFGDVTNFVDDALNAGMSVYGHTLAWHSQQNNRFLNSLIADHVDPNYTPVLEEKLVYKKRNCCMVEALDIAEQAWDSQFWIELPGVSFAEGDTWEISMDLYALKEASPGTQIHAAPSAYLHYQAIGNPQFTTEWTTWTAEGSIPAQGATGHSIAFNLNDFAQANTYYFDNVSFKLNGVEQIVNGDFEDPETNVNFYSKTYGQDAGPRLATITDQYKFIEYVEVPQTETVNRTCILVESDDMVDAAWDTQFWIVWDSSKAIQEGDSWEFSMEVRADKEATSSTQTHKDPGAYLHWAAVGDVKYTKEWEVFTASGTFASSDYGSPIGGYSIAFNLNDFGSANKYYFDNISFKLNGEEMVTNGNCDDPNALDNFYAKEKRGATVKARIIDSYVVELPGGRTPQTPEEKKDTLTTAMDNWIRGMMEATAGKVKVWDAVNEAISGVDNDGDGKYDLQSAENGDPDNNFYWQDYLGNEDYVRFVVGKAREYYEEYGGNPAELKLFINDYNLESWWDGNKKLQSLLDWIEVWESDGKTVIDGIGTQMHVSYILNEKDQKAQEDAIVNMFTMLAESGKLVKISELDMGIVENAFGAGIAASAVTEEQHQKMAQFYQFIVSKYLEIIPAAQQYGITQWCTSDPGGSLGSGWRGGEPVGLWDVNYARKHTYAGFVEGLKGTN